MRPGRLVALLPLLSMAFGAPSPVGTWKGRLHIDVSKMTAQEKQKASTYLGSMSKMRVAVTLKADHTFSAMVQNALSPSERKRTGTWSMQGDRLTLQDSTMEGPGQTFIMSKSGKSMTYTLPSRANGRAELMLTR